MNLKHHLKKKKPLAAPIATFILCFQVKLLLLFPTKVNIHQQCLIRGDMVSNCDLHGKYFRGLCKCNHIVTVVANSLVVFVYDVFCNIEITMIRQSQPQPEFHSFKCISTVYFLMCVKFFFTKLFMF